MAARLKLLGLLTTDELDQLTEFARERNRTVDELHEWVQAHGYTCHRSVVYSWRIDFDKAQVTERMSRSGELARAIKTAAAEGDFGDVADAAVMKLTEGVLDLAVRLDAEGEVTPLDLQRMSGSIARLSATKESLTRQLSARFEREMASVVAKAPDGRISPEALAKAGKAIFGN